MEYPYCSKNPGCLDISPFNELFKGTSLLKIYPIKEKLQRKDCKLVSSSNSKFSVKKNTHLVEVVIADGKTKKFSPEGVFLKKPNLLEIS
jgi:hypothetical protein